jgi:peptidoglycan/xylan/chitin deacetylase (PgdA/CDA1 family)
MIAPVRPVIILCAFLCPWITAAAAVATAALAHAEPGQRPLRALSCHINHEDSTGSAAGTRATGKSGPAWDGDAREEREFGRGSIIDGRENPYHVAFTFDDGPDHETTPMVLDALDRYDIPATFFVVGRRFANRGRRTVDNAAVLADIIGRGHHVGNHTFQHQNLATVTPEVMKREIDQNSEALIEHLGYLPRAFRPPYGAVTQQTREHLSARGFTEVRWNIDTLDFQATRERDLRQRTMKAIIKQQGGVVLMHDTKKITARAIAGILDDLEAENCRRLAANERPLIPVSLHYFMVNRDGKARPVPAHVAARTRGYRDRLPARCRAREPR